MEGFIEIEATPGDSAPCQITGQDLVLSDEDAAAVFKGLIDYMVDVAEINPQRMMMEFMRLMQTTP